MCGIAGVLDPDPSQDVTAVLERLTAALAHRGPDGVGVHFFCTRSAGFGHRRLSIVDVAGGAQPMGNEDGRVWVVANGELYNHLDLRRDLTAAGHRFHTNSDIEVLVHGWEEWRHGVLERLNGIYAFALYDGRGPGPGEVWVARDPAGVKPLYVGRRGSRWWFASELTAAASAGLTGSLRDAAFDEYLVYRFVPSPGTFFQGVWKVPPGHLLHLPLSTLPRSPSFISFETHLGPSNVPASPGEWAEAVATGVGSAVRRQLMSDVPVGVLLSGGVDSTAVAQVMRSALPDPPQAFAIGFSSTREVDELQHARRASHALGVPLQQVAVTEEDFLSSWPHAVASLGEPIANSGQLLVGLLCREVGKQRKVVLSGQGADEPTGGYPRHAAERWYPLAHRVSAVLSRVPERFLASDGLSRMRRIARTAEEELRFAEILAVFSPSEAVALTGHAVEVDELVEPVRRWCSRTGTDDRLNRLLYVDTRLSLADDLLIVADHMSMAHGVELRVPYLDLELLALLEQMPSRYKVSPFAERKWLFRRAVSKLLPAELRSSLTGWRARTGRKLGFSTPLVRWFGRWVHEEAEGYLTGAEARLPDYVRREGVRSLLASARTRPGAYSRRLASLYVLETWLRGAKASLS